MRNALMVLAAACLLVGCASNPAEVSEGELEDMQAASSELKPGMSKEETLAAFSSGLTSRTGSTLVGDLNIEEWQVEGYTEPERRSEGLSFSGWYYFANDVLVDVSDERLNYRENAVLLEEWKTRGGGAGTPVPDKPEEAPVTDSDSLDDILPLKGEGPAHFTMSVGWCGGHGEAVLDPHQRVLSRDGLSIFVDEESRRRVIDRVDLSGTWIGSPVVHIVGTARIDRRKKRNSSIPGAPRQKFLALVLLSVEEVRLVGERADEG